MKIGFVVAHVGDKRNVIQRLAIALQKEVQNTQETELIRFNRKNILNPFWGWRIRNFDVVFIFNISLHCAFLCLLKHLHLSHKPFIVFSFGSDIREHGNYLINFFNWLSAGVVDCLIPVNPDLVELAKERGYKRVYYVNNWAEALT